MADLFVRDESRLHGGPTASSMGRWKLRILLSGFTRQVNQSGAGVAKPFLHVPLFPQSFRFIKTVTYYYWFISKPQYMEKIYIYKTQCTYHI